MAGVCGGELAGRCAKAQQSKVWKLAGSFWLLRHAQCAYKDESTRLCNLILHAAYHEAEFTGNNTPVTCILLRLLTAPLNSSRM